MTGRLWLAGAFATLGLFAQGCVDNEVSFFIQQGQVPQPSGTSGCVVTSEPDALHRNQGLLDLALSTRYVLNPLYRSEVLSSARRTSGRPEMRGIFVDGADIELRDPANTDPTASPLFRYRVVSTAFVPPATAESPGYGFGNLELIPASVGATLRDQLCPPNLSTVSAQCPVPTWPDTRQQLVVTVRPFGHTMGEVYVSGSHYTYPITLCCHCLVTFSAAGDDPTRDGPDCSATTTVSTTTCDPGQDDAVDCRACSAGNPALCQPRGYRTDPMAAACPL